VNKMVPMFATEAVNMLDDYIKNDMRVWEWGAGQSTIWLAKRAFMVYSVEYTLEWCQWVQNKAKINKLNNIAILYNSTIDESYENRITQVYGPFDIIIVDGERRKECILKCIPRLNIGGLLVLDNSNRYRLDRLGIPDKWEKNIFDGIGKSNIQTTKDTFHTTIWKAI